MKIETLSRINPAACPTERTVGAFGKLKRCRSACAVLALCVIAATALPAQTFSRLFSFDDTDGNGPQAGLVQSTNGDLYGTTIYGGTNCQNPPFTYGCGTVFKTTSGGRLTTLYTFCAQTGCTDGSGPSGLVQATNGDFYGTTEVGGANAKTCPGDTGCGTIFKITPSGTLTTLYSFCPQSGCADGEEPETGLVQASNGDFYGTTALGGTGAACPLEGNVGCGTVFKITPSGTFTTLYNLCSQSGCTDGYGSVAPIQAADGDLYGTMISGGAYGAGTVFKMTLSGTLTTLYSFTGGADGNGPTGLVQAINGNFYGTTFDGGQYGSGNVFQMTPSGTLTSIADFCSQSGCPTGEYPSTLIQATDGNFYGTTARGGLNTCRGAYGSGDGCGTIFEVSPSGTLTALYNFCPKKGCADGGDSVAPLVEDTDGTFYGVTYYGGTSNACPPDRCGTLFSLSVGLGPFVETQTTSGKAGAAVKILGTDLTGATAVSFNGTAAAFTVVSPSLITTTVPAGATTGTVEVVTPSGTLSSNVPFRVL